LTLWLLQIGSILFHSLCCNILLCQVGTLQDIKEFLNEIRLQKFYTTLD
jgi:hypothetical protein